MKRMKFYFGILLCPLTGFAELLLPQITDVLEGRIKAQIAYSCVDTPENRGELIEEVAYLYGCFLTPELQRNKLRKQGMWLDRTNSEFPPQVVVENFVQILQMCMREELENSYGIVTHLDMDYGPGEGALQTAFERVGIGYEYYGLLPYKSHTCMRIDNREIYVDINLRGPLF